MLIGDDASANMLVTNAMALNMGGFAVLILIYRCCLHFSYDVSERHLRLINQGNIIILIETSS
jgi:hypothetical protein